MKVEIGESLGYSFLRHVKQCWLVQTNWKASEHWPMRLDGGDLEREFDDVRANLESPGSAYRGTLKGTANGKQFLKQAEIDIIGVRLDGNIHAVEVAFHEDGLHYSGNTGNNVLKKMLRTMLILRAYHQEGTERHIYFASPVVSARVQRDLKNAFDWLGKEYPAVHWHLVTNDDFVKKLLVPTLEKAKEAADTSELFMRSVKLLELGELFKLDDGVSRDHQETPAARQDPESEPDRIQTLVQNLMQTVLNDSPNLLPESDRSNLTDADYCRQSLGLDIGGLALLRSQGEGAGNNGRPRRYWQKVYAGRYFVTNNWWKSHHRHNAAVLLRWVEELIQRNAGQPGMAELESCRADFQNYLEHPE